jgi:hypothetical protein
MVQIRDTSQMCLSWPTKPKTCIPGLYGWGPREFGATWAFFSGLPFLPFVMSTRVRATWTPQDDKVTKAQKAKASPLAQSKEISAASVLETSPHTLAAWDRLFVDPHVTHACLRHKRAPSLAASPVLASAIYRAGKDAGLLFVYEC